MARNLWHAREVEKARLSKSESHNSSRLWEFTEKKQITSLLPPYSSIKSQTFIDCLWHYKRPKMLLENCRLPFFNRCVFKYNNTDHAMLNSMSMVAVQEQHLQLYISRCIKWSHPNWKCAPKNWPLLELLAKVRWVLACSCSHNFLQVRACSDFRKNSLLCSVSLICILKTKSYTGNTFSRMGNWKTLGKHVHVKNIIEKIPPSFVEVYWNWPAWVQSQVAG